jgi:hypothetical protein
MCLFNTHSPKSVRLEEFEQIQITATDSVANHLRDNWSASIKSIIKCVSRGSALEGVWGGGAVCLLAGACVCQTCCLSLLRASL